MANKNLYFRGFPVESDQDVEKVQEDLKSWFSAFGKVQNVKLMLARASVNSVDQEGKKAKLLGYGFVCFSSVEHAQKAKQEAPKTLFKGKTLYICQFETREQRKAHMLERIDQLEFARYKKKQQMKTDLRKLEKLGEDLQSEQGQLLLTLLKLMANLAQTQLKKTREA